jgi:hypothetical protein
MNVVEVIRSAHALNLFNVLWSGFTDVLQIAYDSGLWNDKINYYQYHLLRMRNLVGNKFM